MKETDLASIISEFEKLLNRSKFQSYKPYGHPDTLCPDGVLWKMWNEEGKWEKWSNKPWQYEFHQMGKICQERAVVAANRVGKTIVASAEVAYHMTGLYPDWWQGKVFNHPVLVWTSSPTNETSREIIQKSLLGGTDNENLGTGFLPKESFVEQPRTRQAGVSDVVDHFKIRHVSGGISICVMKSYEQGWRKFQGAEPHVVWLDEEPDETENQKRIYTECLTRVLTSHGIIMCTFTPLLGQTQLVSRFQNGGKGIYMTMADWNDAPHLNNEEKERLKLSYPDYEVQTRTLGVPMMGEGRIFKVDESEFKVPFIDVKPHFARIKGIDFGIDHPSAIADCAWDRDNDVFYVLNVWRKNGEDIFEEHTEAINAKDPWVPVSWPHDGTMREKSNGIRLKDFYVQKGVKMLGMSARYKNDQGGKQAVEPIIMDVAERIRTGRFKVAAHCNEFFEEYRNLHRSDGKVVDKKDDVLKAVFYALMMKRFATTNNVRSFRPNIPSGFSMRL